MSSPMLGGLRFTWQPANRRRHCYLTDDGRPAPWGASVTALCDLQLTAGRATAEEWQWITCPACDAEAHQLLAAAS